tara:strand:+ start:446 stop:1495 length:1050 start_codon:yes stop_codon:yes gene_type:complete
MKTKQEYIKELLDYDSKIIIEQILKQEQLEAILNSLKVSVIKKIFKDLESISKSPKDDLNTPKDAKDDLNTPKSAKDTKDNLNTTKIGVHLNRESTLQKTITKLHQIDGNALQIFTSNPSSCQPANKEKYFKEYETIKDLECHFVIHSSYTINIAKASFNYKIIEIDLEIASKYKAIGVIVHVGKHVNTDINQCYQNMINFFNHCINFIKTNKLNTKIILETAAGQGTEMLVDIEEFITFSKQFDKNYFSLCFDTCHVWSAGFDIIEAYNKIQTSTDNLISVIHFNGSKTIKGSKKDRHDNLFNTNSSINIDKLKLFCSNLKKQDIMIILETPDENDYPKEIEFIKQNI